MKNLIKLPAIVLGLMLLMTGTAQRVMAQDDDVSLQSFYDELSPYGTWIQDPQYGYVWRPDVEQDDFRPYYSNGRWAMTEYGNTWVSNYDWGWAPFHYGRWVYNRYRQWIWIPDTVWGPAWVSWRSGGGYYGWAPMGPSINININFGIPDNWWVFIPQRNIYYDSFPRYYSRRNVTIIHNTTIINNTYERNRRTYYTGPRIDDIRRATNRDVTVYNVNRSSRAGRSELRGNDLSIYNPRSSRADRGSVQAPRTSVRGEANMTRPNDFDRSSREGRNNTITDRNNMGDRSGRTDRRTIEERNSAGSRAERTDRTEGVVNPSRDNGTINRTEGRTSRGNVRPVTPSDNRNTEVMPGRSERSSREGRQERTQTIPQVQPSPQPTPVQPQARPQREERRAEPQYRQERPQPQPQQQRMERQERPQPQAQPQRMERQERQSAPPARSEGRSSGSEGGRSSRAGRG